MSKNKLRVLICTIYSSEIDGPLDTLQDRVLARVEDAPMADGCGDFELVSCCWGSDYELEVYGYREETTQEYNARIAREQREAKVKAEKAAKKKKKELKTLEALLKKYVSVDKDGNIVVNE